MNLLMIRKPAANETYCFHYDNTEESFEALLEELVALAKDPTAAATWYDVACLVTRARKQRDDYLRSLLEADDGMPVRDMGARMWPAEDNEAPDIGWPD
jgi:hypothetical protein